MEKEEVAKILNRVIQILGQTPLVRGEDEYLVSGLKKVYSEAYEKNSEENSEKSPE